MNFKELKNIYFVGAGGIGMSALARYFIMQGVQTAGYDRTPSALTAQLEREGMRITFEDSTDYIDEHAELVVFTPAIPADSKILNWYREHNYKVLKRSEVLELITKQMQCISVAGTHGKTTITTMIAHLFRYAGIDSDAFLGGISGNYQTNFWKVGKGDLAIVEADEYDRSFLRLHPNTAVLTAIDADHLDIYKTEEALQEAFVEYTKKISGDGMLWYKHGLPAARFADVRKKSYSLQNDMADVWANNIQMKEGGYAFDWMSKEGELIEGVVLNLGGMHNVENAVVAIAVALEYSIEPSVIKKGIAEFKGVKRRFEYLIKNSKMVYIDDYAHHPRELEALIQSVKRLFPKRKCVVAFQPHLYSRTRDLAVGFAKSLSMADQVILLPIYPAREKSIPGVESELIQSLMSHSVCSVLSKEGLLKFVEEAPLDLFITAGAGDIDRLVNPIKEILENKN